MKNSDEERGRLGREMFLKSDYRDAYKLTLSGSNYNAFLGLNAVIGFSGFAG